MGAFGFKEWIFCGVLVIILYMIIKKKGKAWLVKSAKEVKEAKKEVVEMWNKEEPK